MKVVLVMFKDDERRDFALEEGKSVIGRRQDCDLRVPTLDVSRRHCEIEVSGNEILARDLGSSNGSYANGKRFAEVKLNAGDHLTVGPVTFVVQVDGEPAQINADDVKGTPAAAAEAVDTKNKRSSTEDQDTEELLDLDDLDFDDDDPMSAVEAILDEQDEDEDEDEDEDKV